MALGFGFGCAFPLGRRPLEELPAAFGTGLVFDELAEGVEAFFAWALGTEVRGIDLSFGGLMCMANEPIWPGNVTSLELRLSGLEKPMTFNARVVEIVTIKGLLSMRLRFEGASDTVRKNIAKWMSRNA